jgi:nucleotide-binding universal stress UspA family protein
MSEFRRICCPIDFSESSRGALGIAARLARTHGAGLTVLYVSRE